VVQWSEGQLSNLVTRGRISLCAQNCLSLYVGGRGEKCIVDFQLANQFSLFQQHWSNAVQAKPYPPSVQQIVKRTIGAMKLHQHFEFGPASQDPFSFCQIQLALDTVKLGWCLVPVSLIQLGWGV
jgi:hypothetical protein